MTMPEVDRPVRAALVSPLPPPQGGIARWTAMIQRAAVSSDRVDVAVVDIALRGRSIHQTTVARRIAAGVVQVVRAGAGLGWRALRRRPDVVHANTSGGLGVLRDLVLLAVARAFRIAFVYHIRFGRVPGIAAARRLEWRLMRRVIARAAATVVLDAETERAVRTFAAPRTLVRIPNCIDLSVLPPTTPPTGSRVLFAGWVLPAKGVEDLLAAWRSVDVDGAELLLAGPCEPAYLARLRAATADLPTVTFVGELPGPELLALMARCDIFVLPSHSEGFPNAVLEAMALGRAVLASDVGAVAEMLADGCGVVVPPADPARLAAELVALLADPDQRVVSGQRARRKAYDCYALPSVLDRYEALWRQVSGTVPARRPEVPGVPRPGR